MGVAVFLSTFCVLVLGFSPQTLAACPGAASLQLVFWSVWCSGAGWDPKCLVLCPGLWDWALPTCERRGECCEVFFFHGKNLKNVKNQIFLHNFAWCRVCSGVWMEAKAALGVPRPWAALVPCPQHPSGQPAPPGWLARGPRKQLLNVNAGFRYWDAFNEKQRFCKSSLLEDSVQWKTDFLIKAVF